MKKVVFGLLLVVQIPFAFGQNIESEIQSVFANQVKSDFYRAGELESLFSIQ